MFYTYVLHNEVGSKIYIGCTGDLIKRLARHNRKLPTKTTSYTFKNKGKWKLVHKEGFETRGEAIKREKELKSYQGRRYIREVVLGP